MQALSNQRTTLTTIASVAMFSRGLEPEFPEAVHRQLSTLRHPAREEGPHIRDLTALPWCSIDNDDSRDLDQLTVIEPLPKGAVRVMVAVADVDALVKPGTPIDDHARYNTTSVYTSARVFHMLPERLCTDLTSLNLDEDRLALVTEMSFSDDGILTGSSIFRARVRNKAQLAYDAVSAWIEGEADLPEAAAVQAQILREAPHLHEHGIHLLISPTPHGELIIGDSHDYGSDASPFNAEQVDDWMIELAEQTLRCKVQVVERWQGVYGSRGPGPFSFLRPAEGLSVALMHTGVGMSVGPAMAERNVATLLGEC